jgi:multidrug efflux pump subunit AcrB
MGGAQGLERSKVVCGDRRLCGPTAYAIVGGLFVTTLLTLLFLPALYVAWFRIKEP